VVTHISNSSYSEAEARECGLQTAWAKLVRPCLKKKKKEDWQRVTVTHMVQHLPSKCEALSSNPSTARKKKGNYHPYNRALAAWIKRFLGLHLSSADWSSEPQFLLLWCGYNTPLWSCKNFTKLILHSLARHMTHTWETLPQEAEIRRTEVRGQP
jgi:hypothetical protein